MRADGQEWLEGAFVAAADDNQDVECSHRVKVLRPDLRVELGGANVGFLESQGEYEIRVWNPGDTVLRNVRLSLQVPEGLPVTTLSEEATIDRNNRIYNWCLSTLNPGDSHTVQLKSESSQSRTASPDGHRRGRCRNCVPKTIT